MGGATLNGENGRVREDLEPWVRRIIHETVLEHQQTCPLLPRVRRIELRLAIFIAFMAGSGLLGGTIGAALTRALGG